MLFQHLWAKSDPYHPLWCHLLDVAAVCEALLPRFGGIGNFTKSWLLYLVALHDIGKADALFQQKDDKLAAQLIELGFAMAVDPEKIRGFRHEARSAEWLRTHLSALDWKEETIEVIVLAISGHHGDFHPDFVPDGIKAEWEPLRNELAQLIAVTIGHQTEVKPLPNVEDENVNIIGIKLSGLIVLSDWIASNDNLYAYPTLPKTASAANYFSEAQILAHRVVNGLNLTAPSPAFPRKEPLDFATVWPNLNPRPTQIALEVALQEGVLPGLAILEAPMGEGKTEGAIYLNEEWNRQRNTSGTYVALPTQATSNQMHSRYARFLSDRSPGTEPRLIHGMAWLLEEDTPIGTPQTYGQDAGEEEARAREWFQNAKRALIAPEGVGTVDQALMAALNVKHGFLRLFGLATKSLVIDEVHAYDAYMTIILCCLLTWCGALGIPVILLSATLSRGQKERLIEAYLGQQGSKQTISEAINLEPYPLLTFAPLRGKTFTKPVARAASLARKVSLNMERGYFGEPLKIAELAAKLVENGGCACVLVNTVRTAQQIFQALRQMQPEETELFLFHARFRAEKRRELENKVTGCFGKDPESGTIENKRRPERAILVATQVVEQSLDVDFDVMLSELAPIDLLLQRSGRLWRHERGAKRSGRWCAPTLHLLLPPDDLNFGVTEKVYDREILLRTLALLHKKVIFDLPDDFRSLIEGCYGTEPLPAGHSVPNAELDKAQSKRKNDQVQEEDQARQHLIPMPDPDFFTYAMNTKPVDEADEASGKPANYFRARTRLGDLSRSVVILRDEKLIQVFRQALRDTEKHSESGNRRWSPSRKWLRQLFLQKANIPVYWLTALPTESYEAFMMNVPRWLRHNPVLILPDGQWQGVVPGKEGRPDMPVMLRDDPVLGLTFEPLGDAAASEAEADAQ